MPLDVAYIRHVISKASYEDMELKVFGWKSHAHTLQPKLSESELEVWQELLKIKLPEDYCTYITQLGNGGAGPAYGLRVLTLDLDEDLAAPTVFSNDQSTLFNEQAREWYELDNQDDYGEYCEQTPENQRLSFDEWDSLLEERYERVESYLFHKGQLFIANRGCDQDLYLLLNGSHCGWCHINSKDYDYSVGGNGIVLGDKSPVQQRSILWEEYQRWLMPFADYFMAYVRQCVEVCNSLSHKQRVAFDKEREVVRDFLKLLAAQDESSMLQVLRQLNPETVSIKSRSLLTVKLQQWLHLTRPSLLRLGDPNIPDSSYQYTCHTADLINFYNQLMFSDMARYRFRERVALSESSRDNTSYPHPSLSQLEDSFYPERIPYLD